MCGSPYLFDSRHVVNQLGLETAIATNIAGENGTQPTESKGVSDMFFSSSVSFQPKCVGKSLLSSTTEKEQLKIRRLA